MTDKLPTYVLLEMAEQETGVVSCNLCHFLPHPRTCPKDWKDGVFVTSCTNGRDVYFREVGE